MIKVYSKKYLDMVTKTLLIGIATTKISYGEIISYNDGANISKNNDGNVIDIHPEKINGENAFNEFEKFGLDANKIANMYFNKKGEDKSADNLFNFVYSRIEIDGTVNAIKNNKIGGNLFFLSSEGMILGKSGVINTGSLNVITPTKDYMRKIKENNDLLLNDKTTAFKDIQDDKILLNPQGTIIINGKINAVDKIKLRAGKGIYIGEKSTAAEVANAVLETGVLDFGDLVNVGDLKSGITKENAVINEAYGEGKISLNVDSKSLKGDENLVRIAEIEVNENIIAKGDVNIKSSIENKTDGDLEEAKLGGDITSKITINGKVQGEKIDIESKAETIYKGEKSFYQNIGDSIFDDIGAITPLDLEIEYIGLKNKSIINICESAKILGNKDINIDSKSIIDVNVGASTSGVKIDKLLGDKFNGWLPSLGMLATKIENSSAININGNIKSEVGNININSKGEFQGELSVKNAPDKDKKIALGYMYGEDKNISTIDIAKSGVIDSNGTLKMSSITESTNDRSVEVSSGNEGVVTTGVNISNFESNSSMNIDGTLKSKEEIDIKSLNNIKGNSVSVENGIEVSKEEEENPDEKEPDEETLKEKLEESLKGIIEKVSEKLGGNSSTEEEKEKAKNDSFKLGGSVLYVKQNNSSNINVKNSSKIVSETGNVNISSKVLVDDASLSSKGSLVFENEDNLNKAAVSGGVLLSDITNNSKVIIEDKKDGDAPLISGNEVNIKSDISMEYNRIGSVIQDILDSIETLKKLESYNELEEKINKIKNKCDAFKNEYPDITGDKISDKNFLEKFEIFSTEISDLFGSINELLEGISEENPIKKAIENLMKVKEQALAFASPESYSNFYVSTKNKGNAENATSISGSVLDSKVNNNSEIIVGRGAHLKASEDINIKSGNKTSIVSVGGQISGQENGSAFGGTVSILENNISSIVNSLEGSKIKGNNVNVGSDTDVLNVNIAAGFASSVSGFNGSSATILGNNENKISIDDETNIDAENEININTKNKLSSVNVAGAVSVGSEKTGSVGVSVTDYDIDTLAKIADNDNEFNGSAEEFNDAKISGKKLNVLAENGGSINTISASGAVTKNSDEEEKPGIIDNVKEKYNKVTGAVDSAIEKVGSIFDKKSEDKSEEKSEIDKKMNPEEKIKGSEENKAGNSGLKDANGKNKLKINGVGSVSVNLIDKDTESLVDGAKIELKDSDNKEINVLGKDSQFIGAFSGAAGIQWQKATKSGNQGSKTVGLAGAAAVNKIDKNIKANIKNTEISNTDRIKVTSLSGGLEIAQGLGLQVAKNEGGKAYNGAASVSVSLGDSNLESGMSNDNVNGTGNSDIDVTSYKTDNQITGGTTIQVGQMSVGGGLSSAINVTNSSVKSEIIGGEYNNVNNVNVKSLMDNETVNTAVSFGAAKSGEAGQTATMLEGSLVYNEMNNNVGSTVSGTEINSNGSVIALAKDVDEDSTEVSYYKSLLETDAKKVLEDKNMAIDYDGSSFYEDKNIEYKKDVAQNEKIKGEDENYGSSIVSVAATVAGANGNAAGAAVSINNIKNNYSSKIINSSNVQAINVLSDSDFDSLLVNIASGIAVGTNKFGGMGSVAWNNVENNISSNINSSSVKANNISLNSKNEGKTVNVAGALSYGGQNSIGASLAYNNILNNIGSYLKGSTINRINEGSSLNLNSSSEDSVYNVAGGIGFSKGVSINGVVAFNEVNGNIESTIDKDEDNKKTEINDINNVKVNAENNTKTKDIAGNITAGKTSIGGSVAYNNIGGLDSNNKKQKVLASINNSIIRNNKNINVQAKDNSDLLTIGAGIAGSSQISIQGAAGVSIINKDVLGEITNTEINNTEEEKSNININSDNDSKIFTSGDVIAASGQGGIGLGIGVSKINQNTSSKISNGKISAKNILVESNSNPKITSVGVGIGAGGTFGAAGSVSYNEINNNNLASIENGSNIEATGNVGVVSNSENIISNYAGTIGVGGTAGAGLSTSINKIIGETISRITGKDTIIVAAGSENKNDQIKIDEDNKSGIIVDALSTNNTKSFVGTIGAGGTAGGAGTVNINKILGSTKAGIEDASVGNDEIKSNLSVRAKDSSNSSAIIGSASGAGTAALGGASDTNILDRDTLAYISKTDENKNSLNNIKASNVSVTANSNQIVSSVVNSLGVAGIAGLSGAVSVVQFDGGTKTKISNYNIISDNDINLSATHNGKVNTGAYSLGGGNNLGMGAGVTVVNSNDETVVEVDNDSKKDLNAVKDINIVVDNNLNVENNAISAGAALLGAGVSGTVEVNNLANKVFTSIKNANISGNNVEITSKNAVDFKSNLGSGSGGLAAIGAGVSYNTLNSIVKNEILNTDIKAEDNVSILGENTRNIEQKAFVAGLGGVTLNANVLITKAGGEKITPEISEKLNYANSLQENKDQGSLGYTTENNNVDSKASLSSKEDTLTNILSNTKIEGNGDVEVSLKDETNANIITVGGSAGLASAFASVGMVDIDRNIETSIDNSILNSIEGSVNIENEIGNKDEGNISLEMYQGTAGLLGGNAVYGDVKTIGNSDIKLNNNVKIHGKSVNINSKDDTKVEVKTLGLTGGVVAAGAIIANGSNEGKIGIELKNTNIKADNNISIETDKRNQMDIKSLGGAFGVASGVGVKATGKDIGKSKITLDGISLKGNVLGVKAMSSPNLNAEAGSLATSLVASAAVSLSEASVETDTNIFMNGNNVFEGNTLNVISDTTLNENKDYTAKAITKGASAGGIAGIGYNESNSVVNSKSTINMGKENYSVDNINISANNMTKQYSDTYGITAGAIASGNNKSSTTSNKKTIINLDGGNVNNIMVNANATTDNEARSQGHGGGLVVADGDGAAATSVNEIINKTNIGINGDWNVENSMELLALNEDKTYVNANAIKASVVGVSGTKTENTIKDSDEGGTEINLNGNAHILGSGSILTEAKNEILSGRKGEYSSQGGSYGGIAVQGASSTSNISKKAKINLKDGSTVKTDGSQKYKALTDLKNYLYSSVKSAGLITGLKSKVNNDIHIENVINVEKNTNGNGYKLETLAENGEVLFNSSSKFESVAEAKADTQGGGIGVANAKTNSDITKVNSINIDGSIKSKDEVGIYSGSDEDGFENNTKITTVAEVYNRTVIPLKTDPKVDNKINQSNKISVSGNIDSVKDIYLSAKKDDMELLEKSIKYRWVTGNQSTGGYSTNAFGELNNEGLVTDNEIDITGNLVAGVQNEQKIKIDGIIAPDGTTVLDVDKNLVVDKPIFKFKGDIDEETVKFEFTNYAGNLINRYKELNALISEYSKKELSQAYYGYLAEKNRIENTMKKYDMIGTDENGEIFIRSEITIPSVEIANIVASGGNIVLDTDILKGNGDITAKGAPKIEIENNSNTYLKINDLKIGKLGGEVVYNDKNLNTGNTGSIKVTTSDPGDASIKVSSNWNGSIKVQMEFLDENEEPKTIIDSFQPITNIEINGNVENSLGIVNVENSEGDILIQGKTAKDSASVNGNEVHLTAPSGSISQGFSEGIVNIGGDPLAKWKDFTTEIENKYLDPKNTSTKDKGNIDKDLNGYDGTMIAGDSIYINASDININGYIQSGYADYVMEFKGDNSKKIETLDKEWNGKAISDLVIMNNKKYKLNINVENITDSMGHYKRNVDVYYNPSTKEIVTPSINTSGGQVYIMGRIASTGSGKIAVLNGTSNVNFDTSSLNRSLKVGNISTNNVKGIVKIVDFNSLDEKNNPLETEYKNGIGGEYNPKTGLRYNWSTGKATETKTYYRYSKKVYGWGLWSTKSGLEMIKSLNIKDKTVEVTKGDPKRSGEFISSENNELENEYAYIYNKNITDELTVSDVYRDVLKSYFFGAYKKIKYSWNSKIGESHNFLHSVKADKPVTVEFFGNDNGSINLTSNKNINLGGNLKVSNSDSSVNLKAGQGIYFNNNYITTNNLNIESDFMTNLNAKTIGSDLNVNLNLDNGNYGVNVERLAGKIESKGNLNIKNLNIKNKGDVKLQADGNINSDSIVSGNRMDLNSREGNIDLKVNVTDKAVNPNDTLSSSLNAKAQGNIKLSQNEGDLRIGTINSKSGNITLNVLKGGLVDALPAGEQVTERADKLIENWEQMGLIGDKEGVLSSEEAYKEMKTEEFNKYNYLKSLSERNKTQEEMYGQLNSKYSGVSNIEDYLQLDETYKNLKTSKWTKDSLLYAMKDSITHPKSNFGNKEIKNPNIVGNNITLNINGGVGTDKSTETINLNNLMENKEALIKLSNAEASDIIWNNETAKAQIRGKAPIGILMGENGKVNINAKDNIYLVAKDMDGVNKSKNIYIDNIKAFDGYNYKNIRINTDEGIFNGKTDEGINIKGNEIFLGSNGNIGDLSKYLRIDPHSYTKLQSEGSIFIKGMDDLNLGRVYAKGDINLEANNIITHNDYIDGEGDINLVALNNIGNENNYLKIANRNGLVNLEGSNIYLSSLEAEKTEGNINLGKVSSKEKLVVDSSKGISLKGNTNANSIKLDSKNDIEFLNTKEIIAKEITAVSKLGKINQEENRLNILRKSDFKAKNGIKINNAENKLTNLDLENETGEILVENNGNLNLNFKNLNKGLININNKTGDINLLSDIISMGEESGINLATDAGSIRIKNLNSEGNNKIETETGDIIFNEIKTDGKTKITSKLKGDIEGSTLLSENDMELGTKEGNINILNLASNKNVDILVEAGNVTLETSNVGLNNNIITKKGLVKLGSLNVAGDNKIETEIGDITFNEIKTDGKTKITSKLKGDIEGSTLLSENDMELGTKEGNINILNLASNKNVDILVEAGNVTLETSNVGLNNNIRTTTGEVEITNSNVGGNNNIITKKGLVKLGSLNVAGDNKIETEIGDITFNEIKTDGKTKITSKLKGDIEGSTLLSKKDIELGTKEGNIIGKEKIVSLNDSLKSYTAKGDIQFNNIYSREDMHIKADSGNVNILKADGENLIIVLKDQEKSLNANEIIAGKKLKVNGNNMNFNKILQRDRKDQLELDLKNSNKPVNFINIAKLKAHEENKILFKPLWVNDFYMASESKEISFPKINVVNEGHLSNNDTAVTLYGKQTILDNADIDLWFKASQNKLWAKLNFNTEKHKITSDAKLIKNKDYFYIYDQKISDVDSANNEMGIGKKINNFKAKIADEKINKVFRTEVTSGNLNVENTFNKDISNEIEYNYSNGKDIGSKIKVLTLNDSESAGEKNE